jgi:mannosyltransferase
VLLVVLLAFGLRMVCLQRRALWYDEAFAVLYASLDPARMIYGTVTPVEGAGAADVHPLLYYFLLHGWMGLAGRSPLAARFLSVILGMVTAALLWRLATWCFDRQIGLAVGLLAAVNPFHVAYSQEARMYALLGLATATATWGLLRALEEKAGSRKQETGGRKQEDCCQFFVIRWKWWTLYVVGATLTLYAHNLGAFVVLALNLLVVIRRQWRRYLPAVALADLTILALFGPWLVGVLPGQLGFVGRGYWLTPPGAEEIVRAAMLPVFTFYEPVPVWLLGLELFTGLVLLALLILRIWRTRSRAGWFLLLCWTPVLLLLLISQWRPVYLERALLPSALFYLVAVGWLLSQGRLPRLICLGLAVLLAASTVGSLGSHYTYASFPRPPFQEATAYLQAHIEPGDTVVHTNKFTYFPMHYYAPDLPGDFVADPPGSPQDTLAYPTQEALGIFATPTITEAVGGAHTVWLVMFDREIEELGGTHPHLEWLKERYQETDRRSFNDLSVILFEGEGR